MKKLYILFIILSLGTGLIAADAVAVLAASKGKVSLERSKRDIKFKKGELLESQDILRTRAESFAAYKFIDASALIKLFSHSVVTIDASQTDGKLSKKVSIEHGSVLASVKSGSGIFAVHTPSTVASVKGTEFMTRVDNAGNSTFIVTEGEVELKIKSTGETLSVTKGQTATIDPQNVALLRETSPDDISTLELIELEANQSSEPTTIRIPVKDAAGNTKYIEITY